jgi:hypothetical protein
MGLFFERSEPSPELVHLFSSAVGQDPPPDADGEATRLLGNLPPLHGLVAESLRKPVPTNPGADAAAQAQDAVNQLLGGSTFNTGRFVIAFGIFAALVGAGIGCEASHLTASSGTLFGFAGAIFGIVTAFLGSEKGGN